MSDLNRMIPDLQASFACEDVRLEASGSHSIVGIINFIGAPSLPIQVIKLCVWTRWSSGVRIRCACRRTASVVWMTSC